MICYHGPKDIIKNYGFHVELVAQTSTSMHGSKEGHMGYIYRRCHLDGVESESNPASSSSALKSSACDPAFSSAVELVEGGLESLRAHVEATLSKAVSSGPSSRVGRRAGYQGKYSG